MTRLLQAQRIGPDGSDKIALVVAGGAALQAAGLCIHEPHLAMAVTMGLNTYPLAFICAYPSVVLLSQALRGLFGID